MVYLLARRRTESTGKVVYRIVVSPTFTTWLLVHATNCGVVFTGSAVVGQTPTGFFWPPAVAYHTVWNEPSKRVSTTSVVLPGAKRVDHSDSSYCVGFRRRKGRPLFRSRAMPTPVLPLSYWLPYTRCR